MINLAFEFCVQTYEKYVENESLKLKMIQICRYNADTQSQPASAKLVEMFEELTFWS